MARDGSGNYARPVADYVFNTTIDETKVNQEMDQIATALTDSIAKDGQTDPTANLPMAGYKHTGVAVASARDEYADVAAVQDGDYVFGGDAGGTATALTCSLSPAITAYADGMRIWLITGSAATGASTLNVNGIGAKSIVTANGDAIGANAWQSGVPLCLLYEAGNDEFRLVAPVPYIITTDGNVHIFAGSAGAVTASANANEVIIESDQTNMGLTFLGGTSSVQNIYFGDTDSATRGLIQFNHSSDIFSLHGVVGDEIQIRNGSVFINGADANVDFVVRGDASENIIYADASVGNAGMGTGTPDASALLDMVSTTKGLLPPRGTSTQRDNISTPAENLLFGNSTDKTLDHYNGTSWKPLVRGWTNSGSIDLTSGSPTAVSLLSGASNVNEIEIHIEGFGTNANNTAPMIQIGDSGGLETTGYSGNGQTHARASASNNSISANSSGFLLAEETLHDAADVSDHVIKLRHMGSNVWSLESTGQITTSVQTTTSGHGLKTLSDTLDRVTITSNTPGTIDGGTAYLRWR